MRCKLLLTSLVLTALLSSCSFRYWAYLRNLTNDMATVDVYLQDPDFRASLPTSVKMANNVFDFKKGHRRFFTDSIPIVWVDSMHFKVSVRPQTTIDLEDVAGYFGNSHPGGDVRVLVTAGQLTDTLMNGRMDFRHEKFGYKAYGFLPLRPLLYYDIK